jgi:hypothetical protein
MPLLAKFALVCAVGAWAFHEGVVHVNVDESRIGGTHLHLMIPAAIIPFAARFAPEKELRRAARQAGPMLPALAIAAKELARLPETELVRVDSKEQHLRVTTAEGYIVIAVRERKKEVYVKCPLVVVREMAGQLQELQQPAS